MPAPTMAATPASPGAATPASAGAATPASSGAAMFASSEWAICSCLSKQRAKQRRRHFSPTRACKALFTTTKQSRTRHACVTLGTTSDRARNAATSPHLS